MNLAGKFDFYASSITPSGVDITVLCADVGGGLLHALWEYGSAGLAQNELTPGETDPLLYRPLVALAAIPAGAVRFFKAPKEPHNWFPADFAAVGTPTDRIDDDIDTELLKMHFSIAHALGSYAVIKAWAEAFGGTYNAPPTRPV